MPIFNSSGEAVAPVHLDGTPKEPAAEVHTDDGAKEQEVAEPASEHDTDTEGAENAEVADPQGETREAATEGGEEPKEKKQSKAENRRFAAERRAAEREAMKQEVKNEIVREMNIIDPTTGKPYADYDAYMASVTSADRRRAEEELRAAGIDPQTITDLIDRHPAVVAAKKATAQADAAREAAEKQKDEAVFSSILAEVSKVCPNIKTAEDLFGWSEYGAFYSMVTSGGKTPTEAAELLAASQKTVAARQSVYNEIAAKSHLTKTGTARVSSDYGITDKQYSLYCEVHPNATRKEAAAAYKKYQF